MTKYKISKKQATTEQVAILEKFDESIIELWITKKVSTFMPGWIITCMQDENEGRPTAKLRDGDETDFFKCSLCSLELLTPEIFKTQLLEKIL